METNTQWRELLERAKNFRINFDSSEENIVANQKFYMTLCNAKNNILEKLDQAVVMNNDQILELSFSEIYSLLISQIPEAKFFGKEYAFFEDVYAACLFISLSTFLHSTKRLNGMSLREFTYTHSHYGYNDKKSIHYFPFGDMHNEKLLPDESTLRKSRNRHLSTHSVYYKDSEWSAMPKDSEHEWAFYFYLNKSAEPGEQLIHERVCDTFKRTKNLYTDIDRALASPMDEEYKARLETAYKKFSSKLKKLKYENYLELQRVIIEHIYQDTSYYGMNIYRLEKESRPYITSHEVKALLESSSPNEEKNILMKSSILSGICFPKLYNDFASFSNPWYSWFCAQSFSLFQELIVFSSHLIFDELIEKDYFGKKWEAFFLKTINDLTEKVFYNPNDIDFIAVPEAQDKFMQILADPVHNLLFQAAGITFS